MIDEDRCDRAARSADAGAAIIADFRCRKCRALIGTLRATSEGLTAFLNSILWVSTDVHGARKAILQQEGGRARFTVQLIDFADTVEPLVPELRCACGRRTAHLDWPSIMASLQNNWLSIHV